MNGGMAQGVGQVQAPVLQKKKKKKNKRNIARSETYFIMISHFSQALVSHTCNPSYLEGSRFKTTWGE
jgi:hypothetical protein